MYRGTWALGANTARTAKATTIFNEPGVAMYALVNSKDRTAGTNGYA